MHLDAALFEQKGLSQNIASKFVSKSNSEGEQNNLRFRTEPLLKRPKSMEFPYEWVRIEILNDFVSVGVSLFLQGMQKDTPTRKEL